MKEKKFFLRYALTTAVLILTLFYSFNLFSQTKRIVDFNLKKKERGEVHQTEMDFQMRIPTLFNRDTRMLSPTEDDLNQSIFNSRDFKISNGDIWLNPLGPQGGEVTGIAMHPDNNQIIYASFYRGGADAPIFKTTNGGVNWEEIGTIDHYWVACLAIDPNNQDTLYAGSFGYLFKSTDGGVSWSSSQILGQYVSIYKLIVDGKNSNIIYGGGEYYSTGSWKQVFFTTTDGGAHWSEHRFPTSDPGFFYFDDMAMDTSYQNCFVSYSNYDYNTYIWVPHLYKSTDGGTTWPHTNLASSISYCQKIYSVTFDPTNSNQVYLATSTGLFKSTNGGANWKRTDNPLTHLIYEVAVDSSDVNLIWCGGRTEICRSTDGGGSWSYLGAGEGLYGEYYSHFLLSHSSPSFIYAGNYSGIFKSSDLGDSWNSTNNGIYSTRVSRIAIDPNTLYVWLDGDACYRSTNGGVNFNRRGHPPECSSVNDLVVNPENPSVLFAAGG